MKILYLVLITLFLSVNLFAQKEPDIQRLLDNLNEGNANSVNKEVVSLMKKFPNNPGLLYVKARAIGNAVDAVKIYNEIYQKYPKSEWADDAIYRVYQYYSITDNTKLAQEKLTLLRTKYPKSKLLDEFSGSDNSQKFYYVQLGAFSSKTKAQDFLDETKEVGFNLLIKSKSVDDKTLFAVLSNKFKKLSDAEKFQKNIESKLNIASIIITD
jgi:hypothetical protein